MKHVDFLKKEQSPKCENILRFETETRKQAGKHGKKRLNKKTKLNKEIRNQRNERGVK